MQRFRLTGPYQPPVPLVFVLRARHVDVIYPEPPRLCIAARAGWSGVGAQDGSTLAVFRSVPPVESAVLLSHQQAAEKDAGAGAGWGAGNVTDTGLGEGWSQAMIVPPVVATPAWSAPGVRDAGSADAWQPAVPRDQQRMRLSWQVAVPADARLASHHRDTDRFGAEWVYVEQLPPYRPGAQPLAFRFNGTRYQPARNPPVYFRLGRSLRNRPTQPRDQRVGIRHGTPLQLDWGRSLPWGWGTPADARPTGITYPDYNGPVIVIEPPVEPDILETYMIANSVSLVVLPDRTPVDATNIKTGLDRDSFSWKFSADLFGRTSLNLVRPDANGPKTLELTINGWVWTFLVERYSSTAKFPAERFSISGSSRTQLLAEPYAPKRSAVNAVDINARQVAEDQLQFTGFSVNWDATGIGPPDWTIPAGALSYQDQTAMQVIARVAEAAGAFVRPARNANALTVLPCYREAVWWWSSAIMDRIIPAEIITDASGEWTPQPEWDSVYVSGTTHGVAVDVRRQGMAGNKPAPDVFDDLITATDAARSRGISEISKGGNQEIANRTIPLFPVDGSAPGLVEPGMLCEVRDPGDTWRGLCLGVDISAEGVGASRVSQVLRFERHHTGGA
ncbi:MAG: hypothetical protein K2Y24_07645 [Pseudomonadaceae bacterium]|nr:hypothetical protein [Pseudomonadaceae bacterium]